MWKPHFSVNYKITHNYSVQQKTALFKEEFGLYMYATWKRWVGIVTRYGLEGPGIESRWGTRFSAPIQTGRGEYPASCIVSNGSFPGVNVAGVRRPPTAI